MLRLKNGFREPLSKSLILDLNQDHILDQGELEALFQKELDKIYDPNNPEDDLRERIEEMARMREHVMKEVCRYSWFHLQNNSRGFFELTPLLSYVMS